MASKDEYIKRVQAEAQNTVEIVNRWKSLIVEYHNLAYDGNKEGRFPPNPITDEDIKLAQRGDSFDAQTFAGLLAGAEQLAALMDKEGHLAAMQKVKG